MCVPGIEVLPYLHEVWLHFKNLLQAESFDVQHCIKIHLAQGGLNRFSCTVDPLQI